MFNLNVQAWPGVEFS